MIEEVLADQFVVFFLHILITFQNENFRFEYVLPRKVIVYDHLLQACGNAAACLGRRRAHLLWGLTGCHVDTGRVRQSCVHLPQDPGQRTQLGGGTL